MHAGTDTAFEHWIDTASVRTRPPLTPLDLSQAGGGIESVRWFVFGQADELLSHPALRPLGLAERNTISAARLVHFLDEMTLTELRIVNSAAQRIAEQRLGEYLPEEMAIDALKLYTDEGYHAYFTAEASRWIRKAFALPDQREPSLKMASLEAIAAEASEAERDLAWFMIGFVAETMITQGIVDTMRSTSHSGLQHLLLTHLEDEWVHARYFAQAFERLWPRLGNHAQRRWAERLPDIMLAFHTRDPVPHARMLDHAGLAPTARDRVLEALISEGGLIARTRHMCRNTLQVLQRCGVLGDAEAHARFVRAGLLDPDQPV
jgi:hypothetical protein